MVAILNLNQYLNLNVQYRPTTTDDNPWKGQFRGDRYNISITFLLLYENNVS